MTDPKWWDCTVSRRIGSPYCGMTNKQICDQLTSHGAERAVVGTEVGEDGYEHFQVRAVFKKGMDLKKLNNIIIGHWTANHTHDFAYCEKEGNFYRSWEGALARYQDVQLKDWQSDALGRMISQDERRVMVIVDELGGAGKTFLAKHIVATHKGCYCPPMPEALDYMAFMLAHKTAGAVIIDLPRSDSTKKNQQMWSAIEQIKNGYYYDKRNQWREYWAEPPKVLVITNEQPDRHMLSNDRWEVYTLERMDSYEFLHRMWRRCLRYRVTVAPSHCCILFRNTGNPGCKVKGGA